jgi:peptidoglycan/LPS O-acetylase OafA/YrhL
VLGISTIIAFVLCLSTVCYYTVERPGRKLLSGRRQPQAAPVEAKVSGA